MSLFDIALIMLVGQVLIQEIIIK